MSLADELLNDLISSDEEDTLHTIQEEPSDDEADATTAIHLDGIKQEQEEDLSKLIIKEIDDVKKLARLISSETMDSVLHRIEEYSSSSSQPSNKNNNHL